MDTCTTTTTPATHMEGTNAGTMQDFSSKFNLLNVSVQVVGCEDDHCNTAVE